MNRRDFIKNTAIGVGAVTLFGSRAFNVQIGRAHV